MVTVVLALKLAVLEDDFGEGLSDRFGLRIVMKIPPLEFSAEFRRGQGSDLNLYRSL